MERIARASTSRPRLTVAVWILLAVIVLGLATTAGGSTPGASSPAGDSLLRERFPELAGTGARVVLHRPDGPVDAAVSHQVVERLWAVADVGFVGEPRLSVDGDTALIEVRYTRPEADPAPAAVDQLREAATVDGYHAEAENYRPESVRQVLLPVQYDAPIDEAAVMLAALLVLAVAMMAAAFTLAPALTTLAAGHPPTRLPPARLPSTRLLSTRQWSPSRWAAAIARRPLPVALAALAVLVVLAAASSKTMRPWPYHPPAHDLIVAEYGPGAYAPLVIVVDLERTDPAALTPLVNRLNSLTDVATAGPPRLSPDQRAAVITVEPRFAPDDERTPELVQTLRRNLPAGSAVTTGPASG